MGVRVPKGGGGGGESRVAVSDGHVFKSQGEEAGSNVPPTA